MVFPARRSGQEWLNKTRHWLAIHPYGTLAVIVLAVLGPFLAKPFNIDDPLFIWAAHQIQAHPADPYGFNVQWGWTEFPLWKVTENPPLACYYAALAAGVLGWSELAMHSAFLLPVLVVAWGTHRIARHFCGQPMLAALAALFTPVFLVSSMTVMCDVMMLAFWVWAVVFWVEGLEQENFRKLFAAGLLIALAELAKYYGACLILLLAAYSLVGRYRLRRWAQFMLIPLTVLCAYQLATEALYGQSLLYRAVDYAVFSQSFFGFSRAHMCLTALAFTGGCVAVAVLFAPLLWRPPMLAAFAGGAVLAAVVLSFDEAILGEYSLLQGTARISAEVQTVVWVAGGLSVLTLAVADVRRRRDARSCLLALWVVGTFSFAAFFNWVVNGRSLLPMVPAVAILLARRWEQNVLAGRRIRPAAMAICLALGAGLAWFVARADFLLASAARQSAQQVCARHRPGGGTLWFQGHWGFQHYMETLGAAPLDLKHSPLKPGDELAVPANNTNLLPPDPKKAALLETVVISGPRLLTTWNQTVGAGFYASAWGPLPFAFGRVPPESVSVYVLGPMTPASSQSLK